MAQGTTTPFDLAGPTAAEAFLKTLQGAAQTRVAARQQASDNALKQAQVGIQQEQAQNQADYNKAALEAKSYLGPDVTVPDFAAPLLGVEKGSKLPLGVIKAFGPFISSASQGQLNLANVEKSKADTKVALDNLAKAQGRYVPADVVKQVLATNPYYSNLNLGAMTDKQGRVDVTALSGLLSPVATAGKTTVEANQAYQLTAPKVTGQNVMNALHAAQATEANANANRTNTLLPGEVKQQGANLNKTNAETGNLNATAARTTALTGPEVQSQLLKNAGLEIANDTATLLQPLNLSQAELGNTKLQSEIASLDAATKTEDATRQTKIDQALANIQKTRAGALQTQLQAKGQGIANQAALVKLAALPAQVALDTQQAEANLRATAASTSEANARVKQIEQDIANSQSGYVTPDAAKRIIGASKVTGVDAQGFVVKSGAEAGMVYLPTLMAAIKGASASSVAQTGAANQTATTNANVANTNAKTATENALRAPTIANLNARTNNTAANTERTTSLLPGEMQQQEANLNLTNAKEYQTESQTANANALLPGELRIQAAKELGMNISNDLAKALQPLQLTAADLQNQKIQADIADIQARTQTTNDMRNPQVQKLLADIANEKAQTATTNALRAPTVANLNARTQNTNENTTRTAAMLPGELSQQAANTGLTNTRQFQVQSQTANENALQPGKLEQQSIATQQASENLIGSRIANATARQKLADLPAEQQAQLADIYSTIDNRAANTAVAQANKKKIEQSIAMGWSGDYMTPNAARALVSTIPGLSGAVNVADFIQASGPEKGQVDRTALLGTVDAILKGQNQAANTNRTNALTPLVAQGQEAQNALTQAEAAKANVDTEIASAGLDQQKAGAQATATFWNLMKFPGSPPPNLTAGDLVKLAAAYVANGPGSQMSLGQLYSITGTPTDGISADVLNQPRTPAQLDAITKAIDSYMSAKGAHALTASEIIRNLASASRGSTYTSIVTGPNGQPILQQNVMTPDISQYASNPTFSPFLGGNPNPVPQPAPGSGGTSNPNGDVLTGIVPPASSLPTYNGHTAQDLLDHNNGDIAQSIADVSSMTDMPAATKQAWQGWFSAQQNAPQAAPSATPAPTIANPNAPALPQTFDPQAEAKASLDGFNGDAHAAIAYWQNNLKTAQDMGLTTDQVAQVIHLLQQQANAAASAPAQPAQPSFQQRLAQTERGIISGPFNTSAPHPSAPAAQPAAPAHPATPPPNFQQRLNQTEQGIISSVLGG